ncbi:MAG: aldo/keto reductase [Bryobacteraceae bacterium]
MTVLGKTGLRVSRFCLGGYHIATGTDENGVQLVRRAIELGVNFFDSAQGYHKGRSDQVYGKALEGSSLRGQVILMSKAIDRDRDRAMSQLEDTLRWMKTDYLDLWQCHMVNRQDEMDRILGPKGALEAFVAAKRQGKVRHIGFSGHMDPELLVRFIEACNDWEVAQFPLNVVDPHYLSFLSTTLPAARKKGLGVLIIKPNAFGRITGKGIATIEECLRFVLSQDVDSVVSGVETLAQLEENVHIVKSMRPMTPAEQQALLERTKKGPYGVEIEDYKKKPA